MYCISIKLSNTWWEKVDWNECSPCPFTVLSFTDEVQREFILQDKSSVIDTFGHLSCCGLEGAIVLEDYKAFWLHIFVIL